MKKKSQGFFGRGHNDPNTFNKNFSKKIEDFEEKYMSFVDKCSGIIRDTEGVSFSQMTEGVCQLVQSACEVVIGKQNKIQVADLEKKIRMYMKSCQFEPTQKFEFNSGTSTIKGETLGKSARKNSTDFLLSQKSPGKGTFFIDDTYKHSEKVVSNRLKKLNSPRASSQLILRSNCHTPQLQKEDANNIEIATSRTAAYNHIHSGTNTLETEQSSVFFEKLENIREKLIKFDSAAKGLFNGGSEKKIQELEKEKEELTRKVFKLTIQKDRKEKMYEKEVLKNTEMEKSVNDLENLLKDAEGKIRQYERRNSYIHPSVSMQFQEFINELKYYEKKEKESSEGLDALKDAICKQIEFLTMNFDCMLTRIVTKENVLNSKISGLSSKLDLNCLKKKIITMKSIQKENYEKIIFEHIKEKELLANANNIAKKILEKQISETKKIEEKLTEANGEVEKLRFECKALEIANRKIAKKYDENAEELKRILNENEIKKKEICILQSFNEENKVSIDDLISVNNLLQADVSIAEKKIVELVQENIDLLGEINTEKEKNKSLESKCEKLAENAISEINYYKKQLHLTAEELGKLQKNELLNNKKFDESEKLIYSLEETVKKLQKEKVKTAKIYEERQNSKKVEAEKINESIKIAKTELTDCKALINSMKSETQVLIAESFSVLILSFKAKLLEIESSSLNKSMSKDADISLLKKSFNESELKVEKLTSEIASLTENHANLSNSFEVTQKRLELIQCKIVSISEQIKIKPIVSDEIFILETIENELKRNNVIVSRKRMHSSMDLSPNKDMIQIFNDRIKGIELEYAENLKQAERKLFKALARSEEILIDLNYFRTANVELEKMNKKYILTINGIKQMNYTREKPDTTEFSFSSYEIKVLPIRQHQNINTIIDFLEKNFIIPQSSKANPIVLLENLCSKLKCIKETFEVICQISENEDFLEKLKEFIMKSERHFSSELTRTQENIKELNMQLAIEKYKFTQANEKISEFQSKLREITDIEGLLGSMFTGNLIESIKLLIENKHQNTENSCFSGDLIYSPEEDFDILLNTTALKAELEKLEISYISDIDDSKNPHIEDLFKQKNEKIKTQKLKILRNQEQISLLKQEIRESENRKDFDMKSLLTKIQTMEAQVMKSQRFEINFVKELFSNLVKKIPENININDFILPAFRLLEFTESEISSIVNDRKAQRSQLARVKK